MFLAIENHAFQFEMENICRIFCPLEALEAVSGSLPAQGDGVYTRLEELPEGGARLYAAVRHGGRFEERERVVAAPSAGMEAYAAAKERELALADCLYRAFSALCEYAPPWGMLTGVRPSKLMRSLTQRDGEEAARAFFEGSLHVSAEKTALALDIARRQQPLIALSGPLSFSLYVSIPFCPTRCGYCSFVSHSIASAKKLIAPYVELLCEELKQTAQIARELGLRLETIYFGGGTPTSLEAQDLARLTDTIQESFDLSTLREYTVEAGRPDTVTREKLAVLRRAGVTRLSINPQSFDDAVLERIGRRHTAQQTLDAFGMAREMGFDNINMDFIAGLPGDTVAGFSEGLRRAVALGAENVTVHTLAFKRAAELVTDGRQETAYAHTEEQLSCARDILSGAGYHPYYMYRQSKSVGNLENTGWALCGRDCLYNIYMMEEIHTVLAVGAGAVIKLKAPKTPLIERIFNFKYPYEYKDRFADVVKRKERIWEFYGEHQ